VQVVLEADGNGGARRFCCVGRVWDAEDGEVCSDGRASAGGMAVDDRMKRERERVQSCLMGLAQGGGRAGSALSQVRGCGLGEEGEDEGEEEDEEVAGGAAEAPDVPRERVKTGSLAGSVSKGWRKAFGRMR